MKSAILIAVLLLGLSLSVLAYADEGVQDAALDSAASVTGETYAVDATDSAAGAASDETAAGEADDPQTIPEQQTPLIAKPHERGWALVNLLASFLTVAIGVGLVGLSMMQRQRSTSASGSFGLTVFGMAAAVISTILFTSTEDIQTRMVAVDGFTVIHIAVLAVSILCVYLSVRKEPQKETWRSSD
jgi:hypothetical protein